MKNYFLIIALLISNISFGQKITKSDIFKDKKKNSSLSYALEDQDGGLLTIRGYRGGMFQKLKGYYIQHFDTNLKLIKEFNYEVKNNHIKNAFLKNGILHLIEYENNKKEDKISVNAVSASLKDLKFSKRELLSFSDENIKKYFGVIVFPFFISNGFDQIDGNHLGEVVLSNNKKFFVINFDFKNKEKETHKIFVFNDNFEMIFEKLIIKDIEDKLFSYNSIDVDGEDGSVYFLGKSYENGKKRNKKDGKTNFHFELNKVNADVNKTVSFKTDEKYIGALNMLKNNNNKLTCIGFYGDKNSNKYNGVCLFEIDAITLKVTAKKFNTFSNQFLTDKYGDLEKKKKRKKKKGLNSIDFKSMHIMANGDVVVNAEEFYITTQIMTTAQGVMRTTRTYHFNDIISFRLNSIGDLKWARNINKRQTGLSNSSFTSLSIGESTHFFINCSDKIRKLTNNRIEFKQTSSKRSNLYLVTINGNGNYDFKKLIDDKDSKVYYKVNDGLSNLDNKTVIIPGKKKKHTQILKIAL